MGFSAYFLVVWDLVRYAKSRGIRVGPGRGSAAGSCVAYCLRIVDIDPIQYDLLFERFLNPGRKQMPDIDMDFDSRYRGEMIRYAAQKYGARPRRADHHVLHDQGAGRGARRARACSATRTSSATRSPSSCRRSSWAATRRCTRASSRADKFADGYKMADRAARRSTTTIPTRSACIDVARGPRRAAPPGRHPRGRGRHHPRAAHRVPPDPAQARAGHARIEDAPIVTQYEMHGVEDLGLLKMDFLGLRNLDVIEIALDLIEAVDRARGPTSTTSRSTTRRRSTCCAAPTRSACSSSKAGRCARCCARWRPTDVRRRRRP